MWSLSKPKNTENDDQARYIVRVDDTHKDYTLTFMSRDLARKYKRILRDSEAHIQAHIYKHESENGYTHPRKEVF